MKRPGFLNFYCVLFVILILLVAAHSAPYAEISEEERHPSQLQNRDFHLTPEEKKWLNEHPAIRLAPEANYPPLSFVDKSGIFRGISAS